MLFVEAFATWLYFSFPNISRQGKKERIISVKKVWYKMSSDALEWQCFWNVFLLLFPFLSFLKIAPSAHIILFSNFPHFSFFHTQQTFHPAYPTPLLFSHHPSNHPWINHSLVKHSINHNITIWLRAHICQNGIRNHFCH